MFRCGASGKLTAAVHASQSVRWASCLRPVCDCNVLRRLCRWGRLNVCPILPRVVTRLPDRSPDRLPYCGRLVHLAHLCVTSAFLAVPRITNAEARARVTGRAESEGSQRDAQERAFSLGCY